MLDFNQLITFDIYMALLQDNLLKITDVEYLKTINRLVNIEGRPTSLGPNIKLRF